MPILDYLVQNGSSTGQFSGMKYVSPLNGEGWVFANPDTGRPFWPNKIQENWLVPVAEEAGLGRIGWHTFRHSHSSLLHALGVDLKVQQELLRHADIRTTMNIYTHAVPAALRKANSKVVRLVLPAQEEVTNRDLKELTPNSAGSSRNRSSRAMLPARQSTSTHPPPAKTPRARSVAALRAAPVRFHSIAAAAA